MAKNHARRHSCTMLIAQALLAYTFWNFNATDEWSEWFWRSFRARRTH